MKKIYLFIVFAALLIHSASAQNDANAKKILDAVSARLKTYKGVTANFNLVSKSKTGKINNNVTGKLYIKGNKYYIKQGAIEIFCDGNKTWNYNGNDEVTVTNVDADNQTLSPQMLMTNFYDKNYIYKLVSSAGAASEIQLVPNDKRKNYQKVNIFIDKAKEMITRAKVLDKSNNAIDFRLSNINTSAEIPENTFVFNRSKYKKNIEIIE